MAPEVVLKDLDWKTGSYAARKSTGAGVHAHSIFICIVDDDTMYIMVLQPEDIRILHLVLGLVERVQWRDVLQ